MVNTIQSPLIAPTYYKRKDDLSINVLDTNDGPLGGVSAIRNGPPSRSAFTPLIQNNLLESLTVLFPGLRESDS